MSELTPLMKQYMGIKEQYPDAILLFRLGDFYEMFGEDAKAASPVLQIALTTRDKNKEDPMPMCGIPYFASDNYIAKLVKAGYKVAVCEQVEEPSEAKGIVRREVVRVLTPGTYAPDNPKENNFIMSVYPSGMKTGVALADASTGEFVIYETGRPIEDELARFRPSEVLIPEGIVNDLHIKTALEGYYVSLADDGKYDQSEAYRTLLRHFHVSSLEGFGAEGVRAGISAGGALISYFEDSMHGSLAFRKITPLDQKSHMFMDAPTQRNLELVANLKDGTIEGSLLWALDETQTPMGGRMLRATILRPLIDAAEISARLDAVERLVDDYELMEALRHTLRSMQDLERLAQRTATGAANARDMIAIKNSLALLPGIRAELKKSGNAQLKTLSRAIGDFPEIAGLIERAIMDHPSASLRDGGIIRTGFNAEIDELRGLSVNAKDYIAAMEVQERKKTGINSLKVGFNRIHGYFIEITKSNLDLVPEDRYIRKQTLVGSERFITPELKEYESKVLGAEERIKAHEMEAFAGVLAEVAKKAKAIMESASALAEVDMLASLAIVAKRANYAKPRITDEPIAEIANGRHPVIEKLSAGAGPSERFIPNDTLLNNTDHLLLIITGPNMAGKSTYMRQVALITLMAQMGSFVPAEAATIGIVDRIFTRIGASDYLTKGQSTFMVEMIETSNILNNATDRSLILLDEVGRGTSTFDGISIAWATAEHIVKNIRARTLFATHYNELTDLSHRFDGIRNFNIVVKEWGDEIIFLRKIAPGPADKSYGIQVARLAGLPDEVVAGAKSVLQQLEKQHIGQTSHFKQMSLFASHEENIARQLMRLDMENMTPEEALRQLRSIKGAV